MKMTRMALLATAGLLFAMGAQANSDNAAGATAACNDGKYSHQENQKIACSLHGGVKTWYGTKGPGPVTGASRTAPVAGAPGVVWANTRSKHYHCSNDIWYGRTRKGTYMYEDDAKAQGYKPDHKACS